MGGGAGRSRLEKVALPRSVRKVLTEGGWVLLSSTAGSALGGAAINHFNPFLLRVLRRET